LGIQAKAKGAKDEDPSSSSRKGHPGEAGLVIGLRAPASASEGARGLGSPLSAALSAPRDRITAEEFRTGMQDDCDLAFAFTSFGDAESAAIGLGREWALARSKNPKPNRTAQVGAMAAIAKAQLVPGVEHSQKGGSHATADT
jgi:hypothetical protein